MNNDVVNRILKMVSQLFLHGLWCFSGCI